MIEVRFHNRVAERMDASNVLSYLNNVLAKEKFFGKILLTYEAGEIQHVQATQNFTVDSLIDHLSK